MREVAPNQLKYNDRCGTVDGEDSDVSLTRNGFRGEPVDQNPEDMVCSTYAIEFRGSEAGMNFWAPPKQFAAWAELRVHDENDTYLAGSSSPIGIKTLSSLGETDKFTQCVRLLDDSGVFGSAVTLMVDFGFVEMPFSFPNTPSCNGTPIVLDEWPEPVENLEFLDFSGYNVEVDSATSLQTGERGLTITTDCDFTLPSSSTLAVDADDSEAQLTIIARNIAIDGQLLNQPEESAMIRLAALDSISVGALGEVSIRNVDRDGTEKGGVVYLSSNGSVEILGELNATQDVAGGQITVEGHDVTFGRYSEVRANATSGSPSTGGTITTWSTGDVLVDWESNDPSQTAIFTATGDTQDGDIDFTGCTVDEADGTFDPVQTSTDSQCPLTDILDLDSVDWCDNYEDNDLCCQVGDPCGYGYDGACQCADSCEWDVMDCTGAPVGVQVSNLTDTETPVVGAECVIVDNETGEPVEPEVSTTSDANGFCWFESIENYQTYSVRVTHDDYLPTYLFNLPAPALPIAIMFPTALIGDVEQYFEIEIDPEDGIVVGFVFWSGGVGFEPVGCAEVTSDSGQNTVYYSDEYGPNPELTATSPVNSAFMLFNVPVGGPYEFTATTDEEEVYSTMPQVFASAVTINYLLYGGEYETNPTPAECE